ncbi:MAG: sel1 repeat family protein [Lentisphaeria bacterium]|nr:sel1 repeat family protein [Lentisphaeria bacterium]
MFIHPNKPIQYHGAAEKGHVDAQYELGECLRLGNGVQKNAKEALDWYRKAAKQGHIKSQKRLNELGETW